MTTVGNVNGNTYLIQNLYRGNSKRKSQRHNESTVTSNVPDYETTLRKNGYLVSYEEEEKENLKKNKKKKEIISYTANRDTLYIPHLEKSKRPVDISDKIIENKLPLTVADLGIQSDAIKYENQETPFLPQKIGRDVGIQIEDGDLFEFDRDVQPLLIVLCGKVLEQAVLEIHEEEEIKNLKEMKQIYIKKFQEEKIRMKNIEKIEIKLKKDNDALKKIKMIEKITKINTQQKLFSRSFAKQYLRNLANSSVDDLQKKAMFVDYNKILLKNKLSEELFVLMERQNSLENLITTTWNDIPNNIRHENVNLHKTKIKEYKRKQQMKREGEERIRKEEEERKRIEEEERKEKRRLRAIRRMRESIRKTIFEVGLVKNEYHLEDISEIDNNEEEGPFIGIYGGLIGSLMITFSLFKKYIIPNDATLPIETVNICRITDILGYYLTECGKINIYIDNSIETKLKEALNRDDLDINNLKINSELELQDWNTIAKLISDLNLNTDYFLKDLLEKFSNNLINLDFYPMIIKALCILCEKGALIDKINLIFKNNFENLNFENKKSSYQAICKLNMNESFEEIMEIVNFVKDPKRKLKIPEFDEEIRISRYFTKTQDHNILINDKNAEFIIRNKLLELCLRTFNNEIETRQVFITFNRQYEEIISYADKEAFKGMQIFEYSNSEITHHP